MWRSVWVIPLVLYLVTMAGCHYLITRIKQDNSNKFLDFLEQFPGKNSPRSSMIIQTLAGMVFTGIVLLIPNIKFYYHVGEVVKKSTQDPVLTTIVFYWLVWWLVLCATAALRYCLKTSWAAAFASALVLLGITYEVYIRFQLVSAYPFSMGWSEASRYYYGSLLFARSIYGVSVPLSALHPSRYILQAIPFLFANSGLYASRLWQFLLWVGMTGITSAALAWRVFGRTGGRGGFQTQGGATLRPYIIAGWLFLYFLRVGVYYHLELMVFIPLFLVSEKNHWRSLAAVIFASAWAGISRVNWMPVPAMLAITLYLLEEPFSAYRNTWHYLKKPIIWGIAGLLSAIIASVLYIPLSGNSNNVLAFASSFSSLKLWFRLLPNDSFPIGILPGILIISGPLILLFAGYSLQRFTKLHVLRRVGLWSMLAVLFAGGLVVSVKIGGGGDLHNMDAFAVLLAVITIYFIGNQVRAEKVSLEQNDSVLVEPRTEFTWSVATVGLLIPLIFLIPLLSRMPIYHPEANQKAFNQLKTMAETASQNGPVLFINERHLLTFHQINVPLVPEYEVVMLMEMAMSNNQPYLQQFYYDLKNHRFAAIVSGKQNLGIKEEGAFADENNIWNSRISPYILCYYEPVLINSSSELLTYIEAYDSRIEFYVPKTTPGTCP